MQKIAKQVSFKNPLSDLTVLNEELLPRPDVGHFVLPRFVHYSKTKDLNQEGKLRSIDGSKFEKGLKVYSGLWFAPDNKWLSWCDQACFRPSPYFYGYTMKFNGIDANKGFFEEKDVAHVLTRDISNTMSQKNGRRILVLDETNLDAFQALYVNPYTSHVEWNQIWKRGFGGIWITQKAIELRSPFQGRLFLCVYDVESFLIWDTSLITLHSVSPILKQLFFQN